MTLSSQELMTLFARRLISGLSVSLTKFVRFSLAKWESQFTFSVVFRKGMLLKVVGIQDHCTNEKK